MRMSSYYWEQIPNLHWLSADESGWCCLDFWIPGSLCYHWLNEQTYLPCIPCPLQMRKSSLLCTAYKHQGNVDVMSNIGIDMEDASVSQQVDVSLYLYSWPRNESGLKMVDKKATQYYDKVKPLLEIRQAYLVLAQEYFDISCIDNAAEMSAPLWPQPLPFFFFFFFSFCFLVFLFFKFHHLRMPFCTIHSTS